MKTVELAVYDTVVKLLNKTFVVQCCRCGVLFSVAVCGGETCTASLMASMRSIYTTRSHPHRLFWNILGAI